MCRSHPVILPGVPYVFLNPCIELPILHQLAVELTHLVSSYQHRPILGHPGNFLDILCQRRYGLLFVRSADNLLGQGVTNLLHDLVVYGLYQGGVLAHPEGLRHLILPRVAWLFQFHAENALGRLSHLLRYKTVSLLENLVEDWKYGQLLLDFPPHPVNQQQQERQLSQSVVFFLRHGKLRTRRILFAGKQPSAQFFAVFLRHKSGQRIGRSCFVGRYLATRSRIRKTVKSNRHFRSCDHTIDLNSRLFTGVVAETVGIVLTVVLNGSVPAVGACHLSISADNGYRPGLCSVIPSQSLFGRCAQDLSFLVRQRPGGSIAAQGKNSALVRNGNQFIAAKRSIYSRHILGTTEAFNICARHLAFCRAAQHNLVSGLQIRRIRHKRPFLRRS